MTLAQRHRVKVIVGEKVSGTTGEIRLRTAWRTVKSTVASNLRPRVVQLLKIDI
jgi:hypothetical protein